MAANKQRGLPAHLRNKLSPLIVMMAEPGNKAVFNLAGLVGMGVVLWSVRALWLAIALVPLACPIVPAMWFTFRPFRPYRRGPLVGEKPLDEQDPAVAHLVELYRSPEGHRVLRRAAARESALLYGLSALLVVVYHGSLGWDANLQVVTLPLTMGSLFSFMLVGPAYIGWGLRTWAEREASRESPK